MTIKSNAFSLIEVMVTLTVIALVSAVISVNLPALNRISQQFISQVTFKEDYLLFLMIFEDDFHTAELVTAEDLSNMNNLLFQSDLNFDSDFEDPKEKIRYRWNSSHKRIDRKSGNGNFQSLLEGIDTFEWDQTSDNPACFKATLKDIYHKNTRTITYCRKTL